MTIAALRALLDEEQPDVRRPPAPPLRHRRPRPSQDPAMDTPTARPADPADAHLTELLFWAGRHEDPTIRTTADTARNAVTTLAARRRADAELEQLATERTELEQRLATITARQAELAPAPAKTRPARDYDPATVRNWARDAGIPVPDRGQIPKAVLAAWREATTTNGA